MFSIIKFMNDQKILINCLNKYFIYDQDFKDIIYLTKHDDEFVPEKPEKKTPKPIPDHEIEPVPNDEDDIDYPEEIINPHNPHPRDFL